MTDTSVLKELITAGRITQDEVDQLRSIDKSNCLHITAGKPPFYAEIVSDLGPFAAVTKCATGDGYFGIFKLTHKPTTFCISSHDEPEPLKDLWLRLQHLDWDFTGAIPDETRVAARPVISRWQAENRKVAAAQ